MGNQIRNTQLIYNMHSHFTAHILHVFHAEEAFGYESQRIDNLAGAVGLEE
ncbi:hypothetical protein [Dyadobacter fermentans]|uniref:hypothetical protein n=1 Tax=Dyadobacter fermentans TaxID=94254 RepID=UPI00019B5478|nr:hypothetical protein [Dyadobacter fermentans]